MDAFITDLKQLYKLQKQKEYLAKELSNPSVKETTRKYIKEYYSRLEIKQQKFYKVNQILKKYYSNKKTENKIKNYKNNFIMLYKKNSNKNYKMDIKFILN